MEKESLEKAIDIILKALEESSINEVDKVELMINLNKFLENYDKEIKTLQRRNKKK